jgi:hypothetical protein
MTNEQIKQYREQEHASALAFAQLWSDLSKGVIDSETVKLARGYVEQHLNRAALKLSAFSEQVQDALVQFQIDAWSGVESSPEVLDLVRDALPV